jgi:hypothetical protein
MEKENSWIPDGFQVVELVQEWRENQQQQGILFDDEETREQYDNLVAKADRVILPALQLVSDLFGNITVLSLEKDTHLIELDLVPDGSDSATENDGRASWEWSSSLSDRSIWLDANYDNLDSTSNACSECYIEFSITGQCNCL